MSEKRNYGPADAARVAAFVRALQCAAVLLAPTACQSAMPDTEAVHCSDSPTKLVDAADLSQRGAGAISAAMDLAVNASDLYVAVNYSPDGALLRVPLRGGKPTLLAAISGTEQALLLTADSAIIAEAHDDGSGDIVKIDLRSGHRTLLASGDIPQATIFGPYGILASDGKNVYFATQEGTQRVSLSGGEVQTLSAHSGALAVDGSNIVIADSTAHGLFSVPSDGGDATSLATGLTGDFGPLVNCGAKLCWASVVPVPPVQQGTASIMQLAPGGEPSVLANDSALYTVYRLVFDDSQFFASMLGDVSFGALATLPSAGGEITSLGSGSGIAVDDACLYSGDVVQGIYSVAKSYRGFLP